MSSSRDLERGTRRNRSGAASVLSPALALALALAAPAVASEVWQFDLETSGEDVFWTSPTATDPDAAEYHGEYEITLVEVEVEYEDIPFGPIDVTDEIPEEDQSGEDTVDGPAPVLLFDNAIVYPDPDDPAIAAQVKIELDAQAFGQVSITEVTLGTAVIDLGWPIGEQEVEITSVRVVGTVEVTPSGPLGDLTGDGAVGVADLLALLDAWGACEDCDPCPADLNGDCAVGVADLLILLDNWG